MQGAMSNIREDQLAVSLRHLLRQVRRIPLIFKLQAASVLMILCTSYIIAVFSQTQDVVRTSFALPAQQHDLRPWYDDVNDFATRMQLVFGVGEDVALEFSGWILEASARQDIRPELIASLVFTESSFRKNVRSHVGAMGPAQVRPYWQSFCATPNLSDPAENIYCGAQILAHFRDMCGDERCALLSYNLGPRGKRMERFASAGVRYVSRIDSHMERFDYVGSRSL
jgi:soluble lytic murein transglycosylase-like protein